MCQQIMYYARFRCGTHQNSDIYDQEMVEVRRVEATTRILRDFPDLQIPDVK